jgi:hypothetical protein
MSSVPAVRDVNRSSRTCFSAPTLPLVPSSGVRLVGPTQLDTSGRDDLLKQQVRSDAKRIWTREGREEKALARSDKYAARKKVRQQAAICRAAAGERTALDERPNQRAAAPPRKAPGGPPDPTGCQPALLREEVLEPRRHSFTETAWSPSLSSMTEAVGTEERTVYGVAYQDVGPMLRWLAPPLASAFGHMIAARTSDDRDIGAEDRYEQHRTRSGSAVRKGRKRNKTGSLIVKQKQQFRGGGIITTGNKKSSSGPHRDETDTLLLNVSLIRTVWYAKPSDNDTTERDSSQDYNGAPSYLPSRLDPSLHPTSNMSGVRWSPPVTLNAGDAMWIRRGWWHCIASEAGAVAVPLEVQHNVVAGDTPCVWRGVARVKTQRDGKKCPTCRAGTLEPPCVTCGGMR